MLLKLSELCCPCFLSSNYTDNTSGFDFDIDELNKLITNPEEINEKLLLKINEWQNITKDYIEYEEFFIENYFIQYNNNNNNNNNKILLNDLLLKIRSNPKKILDELNNNHNNHNHINNIEFLKELCEKRYKLYTIQSLLPFYNPNKANRYTQYEKQDTSSNSSTSSSSNSSTSSSSIFTSNSTKKPIQLTTISTQNHNNNHINHNNNQHRITNDSLLSNSYKTTTTTTTTTLSSSYSTSISYTNDSEDLNDLSINKLNISILPDIINTNDDLDEDEDENNLDNENLTYEEKQKKELMRESLFENDDKKLFNQGEFTEKISRVWSVRLHKVDPTEGVIQIHKSINDIDSSSFSMTSTPSISNLSLSSLNSLPIQSINSLIKPKWPDFLKDMCFNIIKTNRFGHKRRRLLYLTNFHVICIRKSIEITKFYHYLNIRRLWLHNKETLKILLRDNKKNVYTSMVAPHILQQISIRIHVHHSLLNRSIIKKNIDTEIYLNYKENNKENKDQFNSDNYAINPLIALTNSSNNIFSNLNDAIRTATEEILHNFASELKPNLINKLLDDFIIKKKNKNDKLSPSGVINSTLEYDLISPMSSPIPLNRKRFSDSNLETITDETSIELKETSTTNSNTNSSTNEISSSSTPKKEAVLPAYLNFKQGEPEYIIQNYIRKVVFDNRTNEGNTRDIFINQFLATNQFITGTPRSEIKNKLLSVRHFIDGLHNYILEQKGIKLVLMYVIEREKILKSKREATNMNSPIEFNPYDHVDFANLSFISYIIYIVVEESVFLPLKSTLSSLIKYEKNIENEQDLVDKIRRTSNLTQNFWGIPEHLISPIDWRGAINELSCLEINFTPSSQLLILLRTIRAIYNEYKFVILPILKEKKHPSLTSLDNSSIHDKENSNFTSGSISADDLVPIFLYVFSQASHTFNSPQLSRDLLWSLCHPALLMGGGGYSLTVFESSIEYMMNLDESYLSDPEARFSTVSSRGQSQNRDSLVQFKRSDSLSLTNITRNIFGLQFLGSNSNNSNSSTPQNTVSIDEEWKKTTKSRNTFMSNIMAMSPLMFHDDDTSFGMIKETFK